MWADLCVFDPETVIDRATYDDPHQYPEGIEYVFVNGQKVIEHGEHTRVLAGKVLGGVVFGLTITTVVAAVAVIGWGAPGLNPLALALALVLSTAVFSALGALVSVAVREVFEAQTLANFIRFPMIFLCGVFVPLASLPPALRAVAHGLPLTYAVRAIQQALFASDPLEMALDLAILAAFAAGLFLVAARVLARRLE